MIKKSWRYRRSATVYLLKVSKKEFVANWSEKTLRVNVFGIRQNTSLLALRDKFIEAYLGCQFSSHMVIYLPSSKCDKYLKNQLKGHTEIAINYDGNCLGTNSYSYWHCCTNDQSWMNFRDEL